MTTGRRRPPRRGMRVRSAQLLSAWVDTLLIPTTHTTDRRSSTAGLSLVAVVGVAIGATLPLLSPTPAAWVAWAAYTVCGAVLAAVARSQWWTNASPLTALVFPAATFVLTGVIATVSPGSGVAYAAFFTLGFAWAGLFAPGSSGRWLLLLAWPAYAQTLPAEVEFTTPAGIRLLFLTLLWLGLSEVLSALISRERDRQHQLRRDSETDPLTGIANRRGLRDALADARPGDSVALLDLDHFKAVNDTLGHAAGDAILVALASAVGRTVRSFDHLGRWGGEEFLLVMPRTSEAEAVAIVERIRIQWSAVSTTTFSAGVKEWPRPPSGDPCQSILDTIAAADTALYSAKGLGRNQVHPPPQPITPPASRAVVPTEDAARPPARSCPER